MVVFLEDCIPAADLLKIRDKLVRWFQRAKRDLPWRRSRDPYAIWVSEVMLQQTQVAVVVPYFQNFLKRFPTIASLSRADEQEVLRHWEGLGYYRRARQLHQAAQAIVRDHRGVFPLLPEEAAQLPGLGRYTVGAVLSQAFDQRLPVVDANVARVLCRLRAWPLEVENKKSQDWLWQTAARLLPKKGAGDFNQALMELGQTICLPRQPTCLLCPLRDFCQAHRQRKADALPVRRVTKRQVSVCEMALILQRGTKVLLCQRQSTAKRWANMWEFPTDILPESGSTLARARQLSSRLTGYTLNQAEEFKSISYGVTRFRITLVSVLAQCRGPQRKSDQYQKMVWVNSEELHNYPLSVPQRRLALLWLEQNSSGH